MSVGVGPQTETASLIQALDQHATVAVTDTDGRLIYVNEKFCSISGYSSEELLGKNPRIINSGYHSREFFAQMWSTIKQGKVWHGEFRNKARNGTFYWTKTSIVPVLSKKGKVIRFIAILTDITNQVLAQDRLTEANHTLEAIIQASPVAILGIDASKNVVIWNPAAERIFQIPVAKCLNQPMPEGFLMNNESFEILSERVRSGFSVMDYELVVRDPRGTFLELNLAAAPLGQPNGDGSGMVLVINDVTERKRMEKEILEISERERSRVGHDLHDGLGQNLLAIGLNCKLLEEKLARLNLPEAKEIGTIASSVRQAISLTRSLARGLSPVTISEEGLSAALQQHTESMGVTFQIDCRFYSHSIVENPSEEVSTHIFRIAQEAISNAIQHSDSSRITVTLDQNQDHLLLAVKDDGKGFRDQNSGSGMGLHTMNYRARLVHGEIEVNSTPGAGTQVICKIPMARKYEPEKGGKS